MATLNMMPTPGLNGGPVMTRPVVARGGTSAKLFPAVRAAMDELLANLSFGFKWSAQFDPDRAAELEEMADQARSATRAAGDVADQAQRAADDAAAQAADAAKAAAAAAGVAVGLRNDANRAKGEADVAADAARRAGEWLDSARRSATTAREDYDSAAKRAKDLRDAADAASTLADEREGEASAAEGAREAAADAWQSADAEADDAEQTARDHPTSGNEQKAKAARGRANAAQVKLSDARAAFLTAQSAAREKRRLAERADRQAEQAEQDAGDARRRSTELTAEAERLERDLDAAKASAAAELAEALSLDAQATTAAEDRREADKSAKAAKDELDARAAAAAQKAKDRDAADVVFRTADRAAKDARAAATRGDREIARILGLEIKYSATAGDKSMFDEIGMPVDPAARAAAGKDRIDLGELIEKRNLSGAFYAVRDRIRSNAPTLTYNLQQILADDRVVEYLFARSYLAGRIPDADGIYSSITSPGGGSTGTYEYLAEDALRAVVEDRKLGLPDGGKELAGLLKSQPVSLADEAFARRVDALLEDRVYDQHELEIIKSARDTIGPFEDLTNAELGALIEYIKRSRITITKWDPATRTGNANTYLPIALAQLRNGNANLADGAQGGDLATDDYAVDYYAEQSAGSLEYDPSSVEAAAMMFFTMVWGDELGIFEVIDRITAQTASQFQLSISRREVADDLALYALDEQFRNLKTGKLCRRMSRAERQMFYRQVFGAGDAQVTDGMGLNVEFKQLWAVLMNETYRYISKVEESGNYGLSVSAQKVYQAIQDLQYNLSSYCSGMAKVAAPIMYQEMDFVIRRLLDSVDVKSQLARRGGGNSFWKVVETVRGPQDLNPLRNRGQFGHQILSAIARATPEGMSVNRQGLADFVSLVEAYIVAESQLGASHDAGGADAPTTDRFAEPDGYGGYGNFGGMGDGTSAFLPTGVGAAANGNGNGKGTNGSSPDAGGGWNF